MSNKKIAIVIPIYKTEFNDYEKISFQQAEKIFFNEDIILVLPENIYHHKKLKKYKKEKFNVSYFNSVQAYNSLMLSVDFYKRFIEYQYILIYQLDAFVFENRLNYFINFNYDYIGAPWLCGIFYYINENNCIWHVGNGGFSLRKVKSFIRILEEKSPQQQENFINEDLFFSSINEDYFKIAPLKIALQFSFEKQVKECFLLNNDRLPFGCHAWERYDKNFWLPFIQKQGYVIKKDNEGCEDYLNKKEYKWFAFFSDMWKKEANKSYMVDFFTKLLNSTYSEFVLFGAGYVGKSLSIWMKTNGIPVRGFVDNKLYKSKEIILPENLSLYKGRVIIIISLFNNENDVIIQLEAMGFQHKKDFYAISDIIPIEYGMER